MNGPEDLRWIARDDAIPIRTLRDFLLQALRHDANRNNYPRVLSPDERIALTVAANLDLSALRR